MNQFPELCPDPMNEASRDRKGAVSNNGNFPKAAQ